MIQTPTFWLLLAGSAVVFWCLPRAWRLYFLTLVSVGYLASLAASSVVALGCWSALFLLVMPRAIASSSRWRWIVGLIVAVLGFLIYYKYVPPLVAAIAGESLAGRVFVPLGISYYTFKLIHYAVERGRGNLKGHGVGAFLAWLFLFPTFTAGPIERFDHFEANRSDEWRLEDTVAGLTRIVHGLIKRFVLAEMLLAPWVLDVDRFLAAMDSHTTAEVWMFAAGSFLYAYLDFAAYSDIAIGASRLFGLRIMENFNWPILARSIADFWTRWHMSLASWCQSYIYLPVFGATRKPYAAVYATFIVMGCWHGLSLGWLLWGFWHACGVATVQYWRRFRRQRRIQWTETPSIRPVALAAGMLSTWMFVATASIFTQITPYGVPALLSVLARMYLPV